LDCISAQYKNHLKYSRTRHRNEVPLTKCLFHTIQQSEGQPEITEQDFNVLKLKAHNVLSGVL